MLNIDLERWFSYLGIDLERGVNRVSDQQFKAIKSEFNKNPEFFLLTIGLAGYTVERNNHNKNICFLFELFRLKKLTFSRAIKGNRPEFRVGFVGSEVSLGIFLSSQCECSWTAEQLNGFGLDQWVRALCEQKMRVNGTDLRIKKGWRMLQEAVRSH